MGKYSRCQARDCEGEGGLAVVECVYAFTLGGDFGEAFVEFGGDVVLGAQGASEDFGGCNVAILDEGAVLDDGGPG